jgi:hypothetical protein
MSAIITLIITIRSSMEMWNEDIKMEERDPRKISCSAQEDRR